jgi:hypothetical protein
MEKLLDRYYSFCSSAYTQARSVCVLSLFSSELLVFCAYERHINIHAMKSLIVIHLVPVCQLMSFLLSNSLGNYFDLLVHNFV